MSLRQLLRKILLKPVLYLTRRYSSQPDRERINAALTELLRRIREGEQKKGPVLSLAAGDRYIIFSDHHKGCRDGADDFMLCEPAYLAALDHYDAAGFHYIALGDCEELWENSWPAVKEAQTAAFERERLFHDRGALTKLFGNHDLFWDNDPFAAQQLKAVFGSELPIYEGVVLEAAVAGQTLSIFCTHGHQGDAASDGNWFSKFFVSRIWAPLQSYLGINPNTPAYDAQLKTAHNTLMYSWCAQQPGVLLITGHTHQPVFESLTHLERLYRQAHFAENSGDREKLAQLQQEISLRKFEYGSVKDDFLSLKPVYFNSGCCCFNDGDISGIELADGFIRLVKWKMKGTEAQRILLEEAKLEELV